MCGLVVVVVVEGVQTHFSDRGSPGQVSEPIKMCVMVAAFSEVLCPVFHMCWCKHVYLFLLATCSLLGLIGFT